MTAKFGTNPLSSPDPNTVSCPKCGRGTGDDWKHCGGKCPMKISPHYTPDEDRCEDCGIKYGVNGDGYDGRCPNCADKREKEGFWK